jgi:hypothetical protein
MTLTVPDWLARRGAGLKPTSDGKTVFVLFNGDPEYTLVVRPVAGRLGTLIKHTNSGEPVDSSSTADTPEGALAAGLEDLRKHLGW